MRSNCARPRARLLISNKGCDGGRHFTDGFEGFGFRCGLKEESCIVTQDSDHYHNYEDWEEYPVAKSRVEEEGLGGSRHGDDGETTRWIENARS